MSTRKPKSRLPRKLSALLRLAVEDAQACEVAPGYLLEMAAWHRSTGRECMVCMAGAVMAVELRVPMRDSVTADDVFDEHNRRALFAINDMRNGAFSYAADYMREPRATNPAALRRASYIVDAEYDHLLGRAPWSAYLAAADVLAKAGL